MHEQCPALSLSRARLGLAGRGLRNPSAGRGLAQGPWLGGPPPLLREPLSRGPGLPRRIRLHRPSRRPQRATGARGQGRGAIGGGLRACTLGALGLQPPWRPHPDFSETLWIEGNVNKASNLHIACLHRNKSYRIHSMPEITRFLSDLLTIPKHRETQKILQVWLPNPEGQSISQLSHKKFLVSQCFHNTYVYTIL